MAKNKENEGLEFMDLSNVNPYDNEEVFRCGDSLHLRHYVGFKSSRHPVIYDISLDRLDTPIKVYQWIIHLLEKNWITRDMLFRMVAILECHFGYNLHEFIEAA